MIARKPEEIIESWMLTILSDGGVDRFDDLHIDEANPEWSQRNQWIEGGLKAFRIAIDIRNTKQLPFTVGLGFSLESGDRPRGVDFQTKNELCAKLDWSPPSLYLFNRGAEPHAQCAENTVKDIDSSIFAVESAKRCYYLEFRQRHTEEYRRSVFIEG